MNKAKKNENGIDALNFEQALDRLNQLVAKLESGQLQLEESVAAFEEGVKLSRRCETLLEHAEQRLQVLTDQSND
ncbi:MAG: exodeoxyribonuclease VII small subunit [Mariprofundaceae bacterium]